MAKFTIHAHTDEIEQLKERLPDDEISWCQFLLEEIDGSGEAHYLTLEPIEQTLLMEALAVAVQESDGNDCRKYRRLFDNIRKDLSPETDD